jgi:hypothetical protein
MLLTTICAALLAVMPPAPSTATIVSVEMRGGMNLGSTALTRARHLATQMFRSVGVSLEWCERPQHCTAWDHRLIVTLKERAPRERSEKSRAAANPFQGRDVEIYVDRMPLTSDPIAPAFWAHVLVHEITHLLQASDYHAPTGVMKAHWDRRDLAEMHFTPLPFTNYDILLLRAGLARRSIAPPPTAE